jgi:hypothetical protein
LRRWKDEGDKLSLYNAGKYMSAMVAVVLTVAYVSYDTSTLLVLFLLSSCCATLYQLYWDVVVDWGLLQQNSKNPWLRDNLILKRKYLYYISMVLLLLLYTILKSHFLIHNPNPFPLPFQRLKSISKTGPKNHW